MEAEDAYRTALKRLAGREQSTQEIAMYLRRKGASEAAIDSVLASLVRDHHVDDTRYMQLFIRSQATRSIGPASIQLKLQEKGIHVSLEMIYDHLRELGVPDEQTQVQELLNRRYGNWREDAKLKRRAFQALIRRGFSEEIVSQAVFGNRSQNE